MPTYWPAVPVQALNPLVYVPLRILSSVGVTPVPIGNPGLDAITDTVTPTITDYLYYLSDNRGNMHYAATHDGHLANKAKYVE